MRRRSQRLSSFSQADLEDLADDVRVQGMRHLLEKGMDGLHGSAKDGRASTVGVKAAMRLMVGAKKR